MLSLAVLGGKCCASTCQIFGYIINTSSLVAFPIQSGVIKWGRDNPAVTEKY